MRREKRGSVLATLVFTDIVGSSQVAEELTISIDPKSYLGG